MQPFPVSNSTISTSHLADFLQKEYKFGSKTDCELLKTGISHTYLVTTESEKFIFRIYSLNWRTKPEIHEEIRLINHLKDNQIPVSYPIADPQGSYIKELNAPEGIRFGVLFSHAKGAKALNYSAGIHYRVGETIGKIHRLTQNFKLNRVTYTPEILLENSFEYLKLFLNPEQEEMVYMADLKEVLKSELDKIDQSQVRFGAVHTDLWFDNMHFFENDVTIFDFDFCGNGMLCQDLGYYTMQLYNLEKDETQFNLKLESFLKGYESITRLSDEEKRVIPYISTSIYFFFLGIQCQRYDNWSNVFLNEIYLSRFINLILKKWCDYNKIFIDDKISKIS
ncbi:phosphotransferase enzyme family protein [Dyadobacter sp. CY356]|uniref:phosphotransferase enzyme family protein n=1 Tax=Dyadobacter sp. CY356 TaxID=2906442 RepID=UPI001F40EE79|nr:phosphotransferase [Dyadobacter sp. CY356]MCF0055680.1 phosphotransferase [Dyadobacter sp. CY356]